jgi:O-antigen ligase
MRWPSLPQVRSSVIRLTLPERSWTWLGLGLLALATGLFFYTISARLGYRSLLPLSLLLFFGPIFTVISFQRLQIALLFWLATLMGLRELIYVPTPGLPDITLDRLAMLWIVAVFTIKSVSERKGLRGPHTIDFLLLFHGLYLLIGVGIAQTNGFNAWTKSYLMPYAAFLMAKNLMINMKWIRLALLLLVMMNLYNAITSIAEHFHWSFLVYPKYILNMDIGQPVPGRSRGIFLQAGVLGTIMAMLICVQLYFLKTARLKIFKLFMLATLGLSAMGLFFTYTRGSWVAAAVALMAVGAIGYRTYSTWVTGIILSGIILLGLGFINLSGDKFLKERLSSEHTLEGRVNTAATAFRIWRDHPLVGVALRGYGPAKYDYQETVRVPILGLVRRAQGFESSIHDIYLGVLCEEGLVGFSVQLIVYFLIFRTLFRKYRWRNQGDHFATYIIPVFGGAFIGYFAGGIAFDYRYFSSLPGLFYFLAGILYRYEPDVALSDDGRLQRPLPAPHA